MKELAFRQVHLDFHTSPFIGEIGVSFDPEEFVKTLKNAHVNSVTCFAKCHHGMCYYPTKVGREHPELKIDLLGEMIKACHKEGIKAPVYITVGFEENAAEQHPEWQQVDVNGVLGAKKPYDKEYYSWRMLCHNNKEYIEHLLQQIRTFLETLQLMNVMRVQCVC